MDFEDTVLSAYVNSPVGPRQGLETNMLGFYWDVGPNSLSKTNNQIPVQYLEDRAPWPRAQNAVCRQPACGSLWGRSGAPPPATTAGAARVWRTPWWQINLPVLSELQRIVSFFLPKGPCLIHTEIVKGSLGLTETTPSGILTACVPLNSKTWSLSWPLSVGRPTVQFKDPLGEGSSSAVPDAAPKPTESHFTHVTWRT